MTLDPRAKELSLETMLSSMTEGVLILDAEYLVVHTNKAASKFLDVDDEAILGKRIDQVVRDEGLKRFFSNDSALAVESGAEITLRSGDEEYFTLRSTALRGQEGELFGMLIIVNDVTRLKLLEKVRRDFVANVSHELKTPITSIKGFVETLLDGAMDNKEDARRFLRIMSVQADRLHAIVEDLLTLARLESESEQEFLVLETEKVRDILNAASEVCRGGAAAKSITLRVECDPLLNVVVDRSLLEQAVINLIDNAVKYSGNNTTVTIKGIRTKEEIIIEVQDRGPGISDEHLARIFERFYRVDKARSRKMGGTGLGLAIVKHVASIHNGNVDVKSEMGQGSTFSIHLPLPEIK